ncbi:MAG: glutaminyl-tRNA synthase (glutamine-hydrolyzing) subunit B [Candidatus Zambryskibacteria bacterium RIFOXYD1_FULL_40_13]|nr:MAG: Aspartyl/glutamyl-tRNA(Asn/Gln) amidotransferase subunit B [Parcubacteria group bacterium GW2011_GWF1_39_37]KKR35099.1 MAG: Aspartyl/glutamyl-tRNA(Asn/Gln) amidotransferase subunit B [Parcubacteria group bacterium GW2011_GWC2_40_10]KKR52422.1 MAG: Aspartyl/glutamyl-tRNA(Asn/Gln) amidotransferase subunit B [Parcubacteria group bacterium GW2011_GWE1_40_20]KKR69486.1 MAG: Aspartyl/glutamyl-tRNA(Asn/Gln) amidotransferase subunit B [Parcubacteria group bacterium GW2011_GWF2_40_69]KKR81903.1 
MKDKYKITIGLEIHVELKTRSKMFCGCINSVDDVKEGENKPANVYTCPICMGHPGTLPVINKEAVKKVLLVGTALGSEIADFTEFDRKNYFYPDIPKGYQISQYKHPLVRHGKLNGVEITRIHLEEDTARSTHDTPGASLVDYNRAGVPLMELVTEPVIHSSSEAVGFAKELQLLLQYLGVSDANMEKGEMRVEVNFSVSPSSALGTKVEIKNINSFRAVGKAIDYEFERQTALLEKGEVVVQETCGWDENKEVTFSQRLKESAHDYRYFEDPDLPKIMISEIPEFSLLELKKLMVELPEEKRKRYLTSFNLKPEDIEIYVVNREAGKFFETVAEGVFTLGLDPVRTASNYITSDIMGLSKTKGLDFTTGQIRTEDLVKLVTMIHNGDLSSRGAKDILKIVFDIGSDPEKIANEKGLIQKSNAEEIKLIAEKIISDNPKVVEEYRNGKDSLLQFFIGQGMKEMKGAGNPELLKKTLLGLLR